MLLLLFQRDRLTVAAVILLNQSHVSHIIHCYKRLLRLVLAYTTEDIGRTRSVTLNRLLALNHWSLQLLWHVLSLMAWPWQLILIASEPHFMYYWCLPALVHVNKPQHAWAVPSALAEAMLTLSYPYEGLGSHSGKVESYRSSYLFLVVILQCPLVLCTYKAYIRIH